MGTKRKPILPVQGDAFAFPLGIGKYCVCRVLQDANSPQAKRRNWTAVLAVNSSWIGTEVPQVDDPALRSILMLTHHAWRNQPNMLWVMGKPPASFLPIGHILPTLEEQALECLSLGYWDHMTLQPLLQWRWDHDRAAVLAEDACEQAAEATARVKSNSARKSYLTSVTLAELAERKFFPKWTRIPSRRLTKLSREIMATTVHKLAELGVNAPKHQREATLRECIKAFNALDATEAYIETEEREDICEEFEALCYACGLGKELGQLLESREW